MIIRVALSGNPPEVAQALHVPVVPYRANADSVAGLRAMAPLSAAQRARRGISLGPDLAISRGLVPGIKFGPRPAISRGSEQEGSLGPRPGRSRDSEQERSLGPRPGRSRDSELGISLGLARGISLGLARGISLGSARAMNVGALPASGALRRVARPNVRGGNQRAPVAVSVGSVLPVRASALGAPKRLLPVDHGVPVVRRGRTARIRRGVVAGIRVRPIPRGGPKVVPGTRIIGVSADSRNVRIHRVPAVHGPGRRSLAVLLGATAGPLRVVMHG